MKKLNFAQRTTTISREQRRDLSPDSMYEYTWNALFGNKSLEQLGDPYLALDFAYGKTPYGRKLMAGKKGSGKLTHFWTRDGGWDSMPVKYKLQESILISAGYLRNLIKEALEQDI